MSGRYLLILVLASGCGSYVVAEEAGPDGGAFEDQEAPDAAPGTASDAPDAAGQEPDAEPTGIVGPLTLTHSVSTASPDRGFLLCVYDEGDGDLVQAEKSYYRVFSLRSFGVTGAFNLDSVRFGVAFADSLSGEQPVYVKVHLLRGPLRTASLELVAQTTAIVANQRGVVVDVPLAAQLPPDSTVVVELNLPNGEADNLLLQPGSNSDGQTGQTYYRAPRCGVPDIVDIATLSDIPVVVHLVLEADGTALAP